MLDTNSIRQNLSLPQAVVSGHYFFWGGLALTLLYSVVTLLLAALQDNQHFHDLMLSCYFAGLDPAPCQQQAIIIAAVTVTGLAVTAVAAWAFLNGDRPSRRTPDALLLPSWAFAGITATIVILLTAHYVYRGQGEGYISHLDLIRRESLFIALENLAWPLLLQCMVIERNRMRYLIWLLLICNIAALSPYRAMMMAVIFFGLAVPIGVLLLEQWRAHKRIALWQKESRFMLTVNGLAALLLLAGITTASQSRMETNTIDSQYASISSGLQKINTPKARFQLQNIDPHVEPQNWQSPWQKLFYPLSQRLTYPLYQAMLAEHFAAWIDAPGPWVEFTNRLKLTSTPTVNQSLYHILYTSSGGETTSLFYGEGAVYSASHPLYWCITAPMLLLSLFLIVRRLYIPAGLLLGLALWRSSMSGLFNILPSLSLQLMAITLLHLLLKEHDGQLTA